MNLKIKWEVEIEYQKYRIELKVNNPVLLSSRYCIFLSVFIKHFNLICFYFYFSIRLLNTLFNFSNFKTLNCLLGIHNPF